MNCRAYCNFSTLFSPCWHDVMSCDLFDDSSTKRPTSATEALPIETNSGQRNSAFIFELPRLIRPSSIPRVRTSSIGTLSCRKLAWSRNTNFLRRHECRFSSRADECIRKGRGDIQGFSNIPNHCTEEDHKVRTFMTRGKMQNRTLQCQPDLATPSGPRLQHP
jgi:hypothetical protein